MTSTKKRRVALVEFSIYDQFPLISGYLQSYAAADAAIASAFEWVWHTEEVERVSYARTLKAIVDLRAPVVCFSCYVWNMGLVRRLVRDLLAAPGIERVILGGHQAGHHITHYAELRDPRVVVINGQGEVPFRAVLQRLAEGSGVDGLAGVSAYAAGGELWNGGEAPTVAALDDIPSPFLNGSFDRRVHPIVIFETNRGCPFRCSFCTWGGDTTKVAKFSLDRVKAELEWIARHSVMFLYLADANWGMLDRDLEISDLIVQLKRRHGFPLMVYYAAAKNRPKASVECIKRFHQGGVIASQALGVQSLNDETLTLVDRRNISNRAFIEMFERLSVERIDSYCELIWPLPGETLDTLKHGFERLIDLGARTTIMYPAILINNARLTAQAGLHGLETETAADWKSELRLVKTTRTADRAAVDEGLRFYYAFFLLGNCDPAKALLRFLARATGQTTGALISAFADQLRGDPRSRYAAFVDSLFREDAHGSLLTIGRLAAHLLHDERRAARRDVARFVLAAGGAPAAQRLAAVLLWSLALPRVFSDTEDPSADVVDDLNALARPYGISCGEVASVEDRDGAIALSTGGACELWREVLPYFGVDADSSGPATVRVQHPPLQAGYNARDPNKNFVYAHGMIQRLTHIAAEIRSAVEPWPIAVA